MSLGIRAASHPDGLPTRTSLKAVKDSACLTEENLKGTTKRDTRLQLECFPPLTVCLQLVVDFVLSLVSTICLSFTLFQLRRQFFATSFRTSDSLVSRLGFLYVSRGNQATFSLRIDDFYVPIVDEVNGIVWLCMRLGFRGLNFVLKKIYSFCGL